MLGFVDRDVLWSLDGLCHARSLREYAKYTARTKNWHTYTG